MTASSLWLWITDAPASRHAIASSTISSTLHGTRGLCRLVVAPFSAASTMTVAGTSEVFRQVAAYVRGRHLREILRHFLGDELRERWRHALAQHPEKVGRRDDEE